MPAQKVLGFLIKPQKANTREKMDFDVLLTRGNISDPFFFTSPKVREVLGAQSLRSAGPQNAGLLSFQYSGMVSERVWEKHGATKSGPLYLSYIYPFEHVDEWEAKQFKNMGVGLHLERIITRELIRAEPSALISPLFIASDEYAGKLTKRGVRIKQSRFIIPAKRMLQLINQHIREYKINNRPRYTTDRMAIAMKMGKKLRKRRR
ncbi:Uncharacterised protein [uncultured archaeon]|nr:Uncharacterised protein [uncultured archaeon]